MEYPQNWKNDEVNIDVYIWRELLEYTWYELEKGMRGFSNWGGEMKGYEEWENKKSTNNTKFFDKVSKNHIIHNKIPIRANFYLLKSWENVEFLLSLCLGNYTQVSLI